MPYPETRLAHVLRRWRRRFDARPLDALLALAAIIVTGYVLIAPFTVVRYPPLTDLPMHAAVTSAFRHWLDPAWHFQDQFELQPLRSPVLSFYVLGALLACFMPITVAMKVATALLLSLLPIGLAVYCRGMKKNPTMGVAAAALAWGTLTHWGFISFLAALGLTMMGVGLTLMVVERPSRSRMIGLGVVSVLVFFTHVSGIPPYLLAVAIATGFMFPVTRRVRPVAIAVAPAALLFALWWRVRPPSESTAIPIHFDASATGRMAARIGDALLHSFRGPEEASILTDMVCIILGVAVYSVVVGVIGARRRRSRPPSRRAVHATAAAVTISLMFSALYFVLPLDIGVWSVVSPREMTAAALCALAALPSLPHNPWFRAPALCALLVAITMPARFVTGKYVAFERWTKDFDAVLAEIPMAPKLGYVLWDRSGPDGEMIPLLHFPAWVQAERGGWLSFHFATWEHEPIRFRTTPPMDVPPPTPDGFERHPDMFDLTTRGQYFDWILIRSPSSPEARVAVDPSLQLVANKGWWWLYHRTAPRPVSGS
jgi:hypothetical protein